MKSIGKWLFILFLLVACGLAAWLVTQYFAVSLQIALLITLFIGYLLVSAGLEWLRYRLRQRVKQMSAAERAALSEDDPESLYAIPAPGSASPRITTLVGAIAVNGPLIPLMIGPMAIQQVVFQIHQPLASALTLVVGFALAWAWWSAGVTVWRWWATQRRGMPSNEVQWRGEKACLLWPRNHFLAKTELGYLLSRHRSS